MSECVEILLHAAVYSVALFFGSVAGFLCFDKDSTNGPSQDIPNS